MLFENQDFRKQRRTQSGLNPFIRSTLGHKYGGRGGEPQTLGIPLQSKAPAQAPNKVLRDAKRFLWKTRKAPEGAFLLLHRSQS